MVHSDPSRSSHEDRHSLGFTLPLRAASNELRRFAHGVKGTSSTELTKFF